MIRVLVVEVPAVTVRWTPKNKLRYVCAVFQDRRRLLSHGFGGGVASSTISAAPIVVTMMMVQ